MYKCRSVIILVFRSLCSLCDEAVDLPFRCWKYTLGDHLAQYFRRKMNSASLMVEELRYQEHVHIFKSSICAQMSSEIALVYLFVFYVWKR